MDWEDFSDRYEESKQIVDQFKKAVEDGDIDEIKSFIEKYTVVGLKKKFSAVLSRMYVVNAVRTIASPETIRFLLEAGFSYRFTINLIRDTPAEVVKEIMSYHYEKTKFSDPSDVVEIIASEKIEFIRFMFFLGVNPSNSREIALAIASHLFMKIRNPEVSLRIEILRACLEAGLLKNSMINEFVLDNYLRHSISAAPIPVVEFMLQNGFSFFPPRSHLYAMEVLTHRIGDTQGTIERIRFLAQKGISFEQSFGQSSPLHFASSQRNIRIVQAILETGVSIDTTDTNGNTILNEAVLMGEWEKAKQYVFMGADLNFRNSDGYSFMTFVETTREASEIYREFTQGKSPAQKSIRAEFE